ncbi:MAG: TRAP transporter small permease subunit [Geminicoccaceae bacterium]
MRTAEWLWPLLFVVSMAWVIWHLPAFMLDFAPPESESAFDQLSGQFLRNDAAPNLGGVFGGFVDILDLGALILVPVAAWLGIASVQRSRLEQFEWNFFDKISVFLGRVTMILIVILLSVMIFEVVMRYVFERPTLWANELSLWIAGFVFLLSGLYAMQQRSHIRIFIIHVMLPRSLQRLCDVLSTALIAVFAFGLIWGGYGEARDQLMRWETLGTAFDPPIPATLNPMILMVVVLVTIQAISNLIRDWNLDPEVHPAAEEIDKEDIAALKKVLGEIEDA